MRRELAEGLRQALGFWPMYPMLQSGATLRTSVTFLGRTHSVK